MTDQVTQVAQRDERGRLLAPLPGAAPRFTTDSGRAAVQKRIEKFRLKSAKRVAAQLGELDPTIKDSGDAYAAVVAKHAKTLYQADTPKLADVEKLGRLLTEGPVSPASSESRRANADSGDVISAPPAALIELVRAIEQEQRAAIAKARSVDGEVK